MIKQIQERIVKAQADADAILKRWKEANEKGDAFPKDDEQRYYDTMDRIESDRRLIDAEQKRMKRIADSEREAETRDDLDRLDRGAGNNPDDDTSVRSRMRRARESVRSFIRGDDLSADDLTAFNADSGLHGMKLTRGRKGRDLEIRLGSRSTYEVRHGIVVPVPPERRASDTMTTELLTEGGALVAQEFIGEVERALLHFGAIRQAGARVIRTGMGGKIPWPTVNDTTNKGRRLNQKQSSAKEKVPAGSVEMNAYEYTSDQVNVSNTLLEDSAIDIPSLLSELLAERIARALATDFTLGTGANQPEGVVIGAAAGIDTAAADAIAYDDLVDMELSVDRAYRAREACGWMFHDKNWGVIRKLKDGASMPIWQPPQAGLASIAQAPPSLLLGYPYTINNDMSDAALAASVISALFGDFSRYLIRDVNTIVIRRLEELAALENETIWVAFSRHDGRIINAGTNPIKKMTQKPA